jgi:hypothetical protein
VSEPRSNPTTTGGRERPGRPIAVILWYGSMAAVGLSFGAIGERRPFGDSLFFRPLLMLVILVGIALLALRVALARPVPEIIPDRALGLGCAIGLVMFLAGNFFVTHVLPH